MHGGMAGLYQVDIKSGAIIITMYNDKVEPCQPNEDCTVGRHLKISSQNNIVDDVMNTLNNIN
jgi:hypothetical protein